MPSSVTLSRTPIASWTMKTIHAPLTELTRLHRLHEGGGVLLPPSGLYFSEFSVDAVLMNDHKMLPLTPSMSWIPPWAPLPLLRTRPQSSVFAAGWEPCQKLHRTETQPNLICLYRFNKPSANGVVCSSHSSTVWNDSRRNLDCSGRLLLQRVRPQ